jgi:Leucine-rich repeat (LRR) protein
VTWLLQTNELYYLYLSNNKISDAKTLSNSLGRFAVTLDDIGLDHNSLTEIPDLSFLESIDRLDLSYNKIFDPSAGLLPRMLTSLDLHNNYLPVFPRVVSNLPYLTDFMINMNSITELQDVDFPSGIINLDVSHNLITELTDTNFPENSNIQSLNINNNPISIISPLAFKNLSKLTLLNIQETKLTRLPLGLSSLNKLFRLDISGTFGLVCTCKEKSIRSVILSMNSGNVIGDCGITSIYIFFAVLSESCP